MLACLGRIFLGVVFFVIGTTAAAAGFVSFDNGQWLAGVIWIVVAIIFAVGVIGVIFKT